MSVRWGLLSTARINDALLGSGHGEFVAVASRSQERARAYAAEKGIARAHGSYEALLADPDVDAVYIGLPNALHVPWTIRALRAGKHVLCEKPMSRRPGRGRGGLRGGRGAGPRARRGVHVAPPPAARPRARAACGSGAIGRLRQIRASFSFVLDRRAATCACSASWTGAR